MAWQQAMLPSSLGGASVGYSEAQCQAAYAASLIATLPTLRRTCPALHDAALPEFGPDRLPMLSELRHAYSELRATRDDIGALYDEFAAQPYYTMRGDKVERFTPHSLPPAARLPRLPTLFGDQKSDTPKPSQRQLTMIIHHKRWGALYDLAAARDASHPHLRVRGYEATRVIEHSQTGAGAWLDLPCDGTNATRFTSEEHAVGLQRKLGLHLATAHHAHDTLEARGELIDRSGTALENKGEHTTRHGALTGAVHAALAAVATGPIVSGDKDPRKRELQRHKMDQFNEGYISDLVAIGMGYGGADVCYENKCGSPLTSTQHCKGKGAGTKKKGGALAAMGSTHGFGNTNEYYRNKILGVQGRGRAGDKPFDHATGRGWLRPERGDYHDAIHVKKNSVVAIITEPSGGIAPQGYAHLKMLARTSRLPGGRDGTRYGLSRSSPRSYLTHHLQRISAGIVRANARNILAQVVGVKQRAAVSRA